MPVRTSGGASVAVPTAPLTQKDRALFRLAVAIGAQLQPEVGAFTDDALASGWTTEELRYATHVATTTFGTAKFMDARMWVEAVLRKR